MEMAKVTSKGQITIPVSIRRRLEIREGDKILFIDSPDGVIMVNPDLLHSVQNQESRNYGVSGDYPTPEINTIVSGSHIESSIADTSDYFDSPTEEECGEYVDSVDDGVFTESHDENDEEDAEADAFTALSADTVNISDSDEGKEQQSDVGSQKSKDSREYKGFDVNAILNEIRSIGTRIK